MSKISKLNSRLDGHIIDWCIAAFLVVPLSAANWLDGNFENPRLTQIKIETIVGQSFDIKLDEIDSTGKLVSNDLPSPITLADLISIETGINERTPDLQRPQVYLVGGSQFTADKLIFADEQLAFSNSVVQSPIRIETLRGIVWKQDPAVDQALNNPMSDKDQVVVDNEGVTTTIQGILESVSAEKLQLNFEGKSRTINLEKVKAVALARLGDQVESPVVATGYFNDGSHLNGVLQIWKNGILTFQIGEKTVSAADTNFCRMEVRSARLAFLSDLDPVEAQVAPIFTLNRTWQRNRTIEGNTMRLAIKSASEQKEFRRGIGTQAFSRLVFKNDGGFDRLSGIVGIDSETRGRGNCHVLIRGDGIILLEKTIRGGETASDFSLDIAGIDRIELVVEPGEQYDLADHVDWANIRFLKTQ